MNHLILNEKSIGQQGDIHQAREMMETFVKACIAAGKHKFHSIRIPETFGLQLYHLNIADDYPVAKWVKDPEIDRVLQTRFRRLAYSAPLITREEQEAQKEVSEFFYETEEERTEVFGLGAAWILETPALSFLSQQQWNKAFIPVQRHFLDQEMESREEIVQVHNISHTNHFEVHAEWIEAIRIKAVQDGQTFWEQREALFSNLVFCGDTETQIRQMGSSKQLGQIRDKLSLLDQAVQNWETGAFSYQRINEEFALEISPESHQTMEQYRNQRLFRTPEGERAIFELHVKLGGGTRIHILPDEGTTSVWIGYIGPHLSTVKFK